MEKEQVPAELPPTSLQLKRASCSRLGMHWINSMRKREKNPALLDNASSCTFWWLTGNIPLGLQRKCSIWAQLMILTRRQQKFLFLLMFMERFTSCIKLLYTRYKLFRDPSYSSNLKSAPPPPLLSTHLISLSHETFGFKYCGYYFRFT